MTLIIITNMELYEVLHQQYEYLCKLELNLDIIWFQK